MYSCGRRTVVNLLRQVLAWGALNVVGLRGAGLLVFCCYPFGAWVSDHPPALWGGGGVFPVLGVGGPSTRVRTDP